MKWREKTIPHHFIIIDNYEVIIYKNKHSNVILLCVKFVGKMFVWLALTFIALIMFVGKFFVNFLKLISRHYRRIKIKYNFN